mgnify:FL=1
MSIAERIIECFEKAGATVLESGEFENLDSIIFISAIINLESEFDIIFPDEYLTVVEIRNVSGLESMISMLLSHRSH